MNRSAVRPSAELAMWRCAAAVLLLAGCTTYDGRGLVPGQSKAGDVQELMGSPPDRLAFPDGSANWYYTTGPRGFTTHAVRFSPQGLVQSVEQVLTTQSVAKLVAGETTADKVREILGPPSRISRLALQDRNVWEYRMYNDAQAEFDLYVQLSDEGIVREVLLLKDYHKEPGGRGRR